MKKYKIMIYSLFAMIALTSCGNEMIDTTKATTSAYFVNNKNIDYKSEKQMENEFLRLTYTEFSNLENKNIDIYLDGNVETIAYTKFKPDLKSEKTKDTKSFVIIYNEDKIKEVAKYLAKKYYVAPTEPTVKNLNGTLEYTVGIDGLKFDEEILYENLHNALKNQEDYVKIESYIVQPKYRVEDLEMSKDIIGTYSTDLGNSTKERIKNLTLASNTINNKILMPDEEFSMNSLLGELTYEKGYVDAPVIIEGKLTDDIAGGVCQVSSTLYNSVLLSELEVTERRNHSNMVAYVPFGFDATLVSGSIDFKFRNSSEYPIIILSEVLNGKVTTSIYGVETRPENRKIKFINFKTKELETDEYEAVLDKEKDLNFQEVTQEPKKGYIYEVYKVVYVDDKEVSREIVNLSKYKARKGKITMGENAYNNYVKK